MGRIGHNQLSVGGQWLISEADDHLAISQAEDLFSCKYVSPSM
jgi:hypothetical protein